MRQKGRSRSEGGDGRWEFLVARIDQAIALLGKAEINLRNLRMNRLPQMAESLAAAVASIDLFRGALATADQANRGTPALRARMKRLHYATVRVSALHQTAVNFHAGLMRIRQGEMAEYDAVGAVCSAPEFHAPRHCLEARG